MEQVLINKIRAAVHGEVDTDPADLNAASTDASIFSITPDIIVKPVDATDVAALVKTVAAEKKNYPNIAVTARSAGTDMSGGPLTDSIVVDFTAHLNKMGDVGKDWATCQPGLYYRDFEKATLAHNLLLPSYPASRDLCTVGGMVANNSGGEKSHFYGKTTHFVESLDLVLSDGTTCEAHALTPSELVQKKSLNTLEGKIYRELSDLLELNAKTIAAHKPKVKKNSAGYYLWDVWQGHNFDLTKVVAGSQGTLALVTDIKFRLITPKKYSELLVMFLSDLAPLGTLVDALIEYKPESLESYDDQTLKLAMRFLPELITHMKGHALLLPFRFIPEFLMLLEGGVPKLVMIAEFTGDDEAVVSKKVDGVRTKIKEQFRIPTRIARHPADAQKYWVVRHESFNLLRKHVRGLKTAPFIDDFVVPPDCLPDFLPKLNVLLKKYPTLIYTIAGHPGDGNFHIIPLMDLKRAEDRAIIPELSKKVYDLVLSFDGSITGEHNDGLIRTPYLEQMYGPEMCSLFAQVKRIFDPQNIFNPGKKVNGSLAYAMAHMKKS